MLNHLRGGRRAALMRGVSAYAPHPLLRQVVARPQSTLASSFMASSQAESAVEWRRKHTAMEEQELLELAPCRPAVGVAVEALAAAPLRHAELLAEHGHLRVDGLLDAASVEALRVHVDEVLDASVAAVAGRQAEFLSRFGPVMCRQKRFDVLLRIDALVLGAVQELLRALSPTIMAAIGEDCYLCELSALVSDPGAGAQPVHHDNTFDGGNPRVSILLALQDVEDQMGPTCILPGTNTPDWHVAYAERGDEFEELLVGEEHVLASLRAGDVLVYDTRVLHFGGANLSRQVEDPAAEEGRRRRLMVVSAQEEDSINRRGHTNIDPRYRGKFRISEFETWTSLP